MTQARCRATYPGTSDAAKAPRCVEPVHPPSEAHISAPDPNGMSYGWWDDGHGTAEGIRLSITLASQLRVVR